MSDDIAPCGTYAGYQTHKRRRTQPCDECRVANREYHRHYRAKNDEARDRDYRYSLARNRAVQRLIDLHPAQFKALLADERASA